MVKINRIYTRTGDSGSTGLIGGVRVSKSAHRVKAYGDIDELNAWLGHIRTLSIREARTEPKRQVIVTYLEQLQHELFDVGAELATPPPKKQRTSGGRRSPRSRAASSLPPFPETHAQRLEGWIDALIAGLPELTSFVLPGGSELHSALHLARTVCRRAERTVCELAERENVSSAILVYLNRLSDLLFAMTRYEAHISGMPELLWVPAAKR